MSIFLQGIISGLILGAVYSIMTVGLTLIYGSLRTLNMAQGGFIMVGGYAAWLAYLHLGLSPWLGLFVAAGVAAACGIVMYFTALHPVVGKKNIDFGLTAYMSTMMFNLILVNLAIILFGARNKAIPSLIEGGFALPGQIHVTWHAVAIAVVAAASLGFLAWFLNRVRHGLAVMAIAQDLQAARLMGVNTWMIYAVAVALAAALGGIAGVLLAPLYFIYPTAGALPLLKGIIIAVLGGLGSIRGTVYAAFLVGLIESLASTYLGTQWSLPILFMVVVIVLAVRPWGLAGLPQEERL
jgi:branched-subunit amino acid ABC-type transport system permease component